MTKASTSATPLDDAMSFVAQRAVPRPIATPPALPLVSAEPVAAIPEPTVQTNDALISGSPSQQPANDQRAKEKKDPALANVDYAAFFLRPVRGRKAKTIYISEDMHTALVTITQASPELIGLSDLLINIVTHHFETFGPGIRQFLNAQEKIRKQKLPY